MLVNPPSIEIVQIFSSLGASPLVTPLDAKPVLALDIFPVAASFVVPPMLHFPF